jgi:hypothetical protein
MRTQRTTQSILALLIVFLILARSSQAQAPAAGAPANSNSNGMSRGTAGMLAGGMVVLFAFAAHGYHARHINSHRQPAGPRHHQHKQFQLPHGRGAVTRGRA